MKQKIFLILALGLAFTALVTMVAPTQLVFADTSVTVGLNLSRKQLWKAFLPELQDPEGKHKLRPYFPKQIGVE